MIYHKDKGTIKVEPQHEDIQTNTEIKLKLQDKIP